MLTTEQLTPALGEAWAHALHAEFQKPYMIEVMRRITRDRSTGTVYPERKDVFRAFRLTPLPQVKAVVIGQDPYHGELPGGEPQATGLAFGVGREGKPAYGQEPPSLKNVFKELEDDLGLSDLAPNPSLEQWATEGVLLLNSALTVRKGEAGSHSAIGWHRFTRAVLGLLSERERPICFIMWGGHARSFKAYLDPFTNHFIESYHPSPLSAYRGFFGSKPFSKTNEKLSSEGLAPIRWHGGGSSIQ